MLFMEILAVFSENHTKHINEFCVQNAELFIVKAGVTYIHHWALKGSVLTDLCAIPLSHCASQ
jgi:hypothetical protein